MNAEERRQVADGFEATRAPGLSIYDAARVFRIAVVNLEWALEMTDPATATERQEDGFNQDYADDELDKTAPRWRAARDELRHQLEQHASRFHG